jgi:hypothetical protein
MVKKMLAPGGPSATQLSKDVGIGQSTLSRWIRTMGTVSAESKTEGGRRPQDWTAEQKWKAVTEAAVLSEAEVGAYLRRAGLHSDHLHQWRNEMMDAVRKNPTVGRTKTELAQAKKRIRELERELRRKDKALAEAAALLVLKKKADLIWGTVDEDDGSK